MASQINLISIDGSPVVRFKVILVLNVFDKLYCGIVRLFYDTKFTIGIIAQ